MSIIMAWLALNLLWYQNFCKTLGHDFMGVKKVESRKIEKLGYLQSVIGVFFIGEFIYNKTCLERPLLGIISKVLIRFLDEKNFVLWVGGFNSLSYWKLCDIFIRKSNFVYDLFLILESAVGLKLRLLVNWKVHLQMNQKIFIEKSQNCSLV